MIPKFVFIAALLCCFSHAQEDEEQDIPTLSPLELESNHGDNGRIIQGRHAIAGQFPHQAGLYLYGPDGIYSFCGGALIHPEWVLTAAHCVDGSVSITVRLGTLKSKGNSESSLQVINSTFSIKHNQYVLNDTVLLNDIALIKLSQPAKLNVYVQVIILDSDYLPDNSFVTVSGWGKTSDNGDVAQNLNFVNLRTISNQNCRKFYSAELITAATVCTKGFSNQGICQGDSGGPLVQYRNGTTVHVGIVSFSSGYGCQAGYPSGYIRTAYYRQWIRSHSRV